jgi:hypothetical protein
MKKMYIFACLLFGATFAMAQNEAVSACVNTDAGTVTITFDNSLNCSTAPGSLAGKEQIGFHSGGNQWSAVVAWDDAGAEPAANIGDDVFSVTVTPADYYGIALGSLQSIYFVFNQGPTNPGEPWSSEGKGEDNGSCVDFFVTIADLGACTSSTIDVELSSSLKVMPNPMNDFAVIRFSNDNNRVFNIQISSLTGQVVRSFQNVRGDSLEIEKGSLTNGMYFVTFRTENGKVATTKLIVQ